MATYFVVVRPTGPAWDRAKPLELVAVYESAGWIDDGGRRHDEVLGAHVNEVRYRTTLRPYLPASEAAGSPWMVARLGRVSVRVRADTEQLALDGDVAIVDEQPLAMR